MYHRSLECLDRFKAESPNFRKFLDVRERDERERKGGRGEMGREREEVGRRDKGRAGREGEMRERGRGDI